MKALLQILIVVICASLVIYLDILLYDYIVNLIPNGDWKPLLKVVIVVIMIIYTTSLVVLFTAIASVVALGILEMIFHSNKSKQKNQITFKRQNKL